MIFILPVIFTGVIFEFNTFACDIINCFKQN
jgi:hypothetical protein